MLTESSWNTQLIPRSTGRVADRAAVEALQSNIRTISTLLLPVQNQLKRHQVGRATHRSRAAANILLSYLLVPDSCPKDSDYRNDTPKTYPGPVAPVGMP